MIKTTKKVIKKIPGELHHHAMLAIFFGLLAVSFSLLAMKNLANAQDSTITDRVACSYITGDWSDCDSTGTQTRTITRTPDNCYDTNTIPSKTQSCTYAVPCSFSYNAWGTCDSTGYQTRSVSSRTPEGCYDSVNPILKQPCTYSVTVASAVKISCSYNLSSWGECKSSGKQSRTIISKTPVGCFETDLPKLERLCDYGSASRTVGTQENNNVTPYFNFLNLSGGEVVSGEIKIQGTVDVANSIEFYLLPAESNNPKYLGLAKYIGQKTWEYTLDSKSQPNGSFHIYTKIKNAYGVYDGEKRMLIILNANEEMQNAGNKSEETGNGANNRISNEWQNKYFKSDNCLDQSICGGEVDPDRDGVSNNEEYRLGLNPTNPDTDQDGFLDGDEIKNGFDPLKSSPGDKSDKMVFESPKEKGEIKKDEYKVETVELANFQEGKKLKLTGRALPNTYVTIYIYSDPIVLTVKTDADGNWSYVLDKDLEDGNHQVYVAVTDNTGKITAKSEPLAFVKTAEAASIVSPAEASAGDRAVSPTKSWSNNGLYFFITLGLGALALAVAVLGLIKHNLNKKEENRLV
ncbi:MAG: Ig-like domain-containing protein [Parcubacteria group bacterium]|jgi:hypothetical protein